MPRHQSACRTTLATLLLCLAPAAQAALELRTFSPRPIRFELNRGQVDCEARFLVRQGREVVYLTDSGLRTRGPDGRALSVEVVGARPSPAVRGVSELPGRSHHYRGREPERWVTDVPGYAGVELLGVRPGVDLQWHGRRGELEMDLVLAAGVEPSDLALRLEGFDGLAVEQGREVVAWSGTQLLRLTVPAVYQLGPEGARQVACRVRLDARGDVVFELGPRDPTLVTVLDPVIAYSTYLGGTDGDHGYGSVRDEAGHLYLVGYARSLDFPAEPAPQPHAGVFDAFVTKLSPDGASLEYSVLLGGDDQDSLGDLAIDADGSAVVVGASRSQDFPILGGFQDTLAGRRDAVVLRLDETGALAWSSFYGGSRDDRASRVAIDSDGAVHVVGNTESADLATPDGFRTELGGPSDAFVAALSADGLSLIRSSYFGGSGHDQASGLVLGAGGEILFAGTTQSDDLPASGGFQPSSRGGADAFVAGVDPSGSLVFATYYGGAFDDAAHDLVLDSEGFLLLGGNTFSDDLPRSAPTLAGWAGSRDGFIARLAANGSALVDATYFGGTGDDFVSGLAAAPDGAVYFSGHTTSADLPLVEAFVETLGAGTDLYVAQLAPRWSRLAFASYLGTGGSSGSSSLSPAGPGCVVLSGQTGSLAFPTHQAFQDLLGGTGLAGNGDGFLTVVCDKNCTDGLDDDGDGDIDCDDSDCAAHPACIPEDCFNGLDDDRDGRTDCEDPECCGRVADCPAGAAESDCANGLDDDCDGLADCRDEACAGDPACLELCGNGFDDDWDGLVDCADPDCCGLDPWCPLQPRETDCGDGIDDDCDGLLDCEDCADCAGSCFYFDESDCTDGIDNDCDGLTDCQDSSFCCGTCFERTCNDGIDDDCDGLVDCEDPDCAGATCSESACADGVDDDLDGSTDCADPDCLGDPACASEDSDGDGEPNGTDCAPEDATTWTPVPELDLLVVARSATGPRDVLLGWELPTGAGLGRVHADLARGELAELWATRVADAPCVVTRFGGDSLVDGFDRPSPDLYYLVRAANACGPPPGEGWGRDSSGVQRPACP